MVSRQVTSIDEISTLPPSAPGAVPAEAGAVPAEAGQSSEQRTPSQEELLACYREAQVHPTVLPPVPEFESREVRLLGGAARAPQRIQDIRRRLVENGSMSAEDFTRLSAALQDQQVQSPTSLLSPLHLDARYGINAGSQSILRGMAREGLGPVSQGESAAHVL